MFLLIDNYDSFTYNLWHFLGELGADVEVRRNDAVTVEEALDMGPCGIVISPGPCDPDRAGVSLDLVRRAPPDMPVLGVCLGHQCIAQAFGGRIVRSARPMHGKISTIRNAGGGIFTDLPRSFAATRYHSLTVERESLPGSLAITAETDDGVIMALEHQSRPVFGLQFHPESIASENGYRLLANFLARAGAPSTPIHPIEQLETTLKKSLS